MKKLFVLCALAAVAFAGCDSDAGGNGHNNDYEVTALTLKNQSGVELLEVKWGDFAFTGPFSGPSWKESLPSGSSAAQTLSEFKGYGGAQGYIFFKRKAYPFALRTQETIVVEGGESSEFTFTNNTVITYVDTPNKTRTLNSLRNIVAWFDDAEGTMQPYQERQGQVFYYHASHIGPPINVSALYPKDGASSIAVGGGTSSDPARLHLKVNLTGAAKLSFWYANQAYGSDGTTFSINGDVKQTWTTNTAWASLEHDLQAGETNLIWEKKDGSSGYGSYYLSLDDILIYYTD